MRPEREIEARRLGEIWARLDEVPDPELDEPITAMGFVELVTLGEGDRVEVDFRLPTYWCSPNFAFLMAEGIVIGLIGAIIPVAILRSIYGGVVNFVLGKFSV